MDPSSDTSRRSDQEALGAEQPPAVTAAPGHPILRYTIRRLLVGVGLVFVISALLFAATEILPGDPAAAMLGRNATPERVAAVRENLGLNRPPVERYVDWLTGFVQGDLGESFVTRRTVTDAIAPRIGNTLVLAAITLSVGTPIALGLGLWAGIRAGKRTDRAISASGMALGSTPEFVLGTLLIIVLATNLGLLLPVSLIIPGESPLSQLDLLILPILTMVLVGIIPFPARMVRAGVAEAIQSDYVEMARLNGVPGTPGSLEIRGQELPGPDRAGHGPHPAVVAWLGDHRRGPLQLPGHR